MQSRALTGILAVLLAASRPGGMPGALAAPPQHLALEYVSPLPGSRYILPATTLTLRADRPIDPAAAGSLVLDISGSLTGSHLWTSRLSDDARTTIVTPTIPFGAGEVVTVRLDTSVVTGGRAGETGSLSFTIASRIPDRSASRHLMRAAEFPPSVSVRQQSRAHSPAGTPGGGELPNISVTVSTPTAPGYLFLSNLIWGTQFTPALLILKNDGTPVFARDLPADGYDFKPHPDGTLTYYDDLTQLFVVMDSACAPIGQIGCGNGYETDPHDLRILPNGHALLLGVDNQYVDMSKLVSGGSTNALVVGCVIQELDGRSNVVFQWRSFDHYRITDAEHIDLTAYWIDDVHGNALDVDTDGNILFSSRHMNEVTKINRQTGDIIWRLGGKNNQFTFINDSIGFSYQHAVRRIANGDITLFDNGDFHDPAFSRAVEYRLDEVNKTATLVWQYRNSPDVEGYAMGYVQRLENGNTLIGWGAGNPTVTEVSPNGTKLYEMSFDPGVFSYRAYRYNWTPPLTAAAPAAAPAAFALAQNYPNPFNPATTIQFSLPREAHVTLALYNLIGQRVMSLVDGVRAPGTYSVRVDGSHLASGVYLCRLEAGTFVSTKKLVNLR